ncbi:hypothetical protein ACQ4PT_060293 [Festuca glaucescens]
MSSEAQQPHAVLIPQPAQGHVTPMLHLAKVLHARGFHVTFVNSEYNHRRLLRSRGPGSLDGVDGFRFEAVPDGLPPSDDDDVTQDIAALCLSTTKHSAAPFGELLVRLSSGTPPVSCVIADGVMSFAQRVAEDMGVPALVFWTTSACGFMGYLQFAELVRRGYVPLKDEGDLTNGYLDTEIDWIPGMEGVRLKDIPSFIRTTDPDDVMLNYDGPEAQNARGARGLILNTYDALEQDVVDALRREFPRVYTVGPLPAFARAADGGELDAIGGNLWKEDASCLRWLDAQEQPGSVVYVNFGSITVVTPAQLAEFAWGLASCGRPFLWVVRPDLVSGEKAVLPKEFVRDTKDRGVLASWCPQEQVLSHPSVGLFLTHCGWNSTLESVCAGVPMVCWPFFAEQPTNCRYACTNWGIGMEIGSGVAREDVARLVLEAMDGEKGKDMRAKAATWKEKAVAATVEGGSSSENLDRLVEFLRAGCM